MLYFYIDYVSCWKLPVYMSHNPVAPCVMCYCDISSKLSGTAALDARRLLSEWKHQNDVCFTWKTEITQDDGSCKSRWWH